MPESPSAVLALEQAARYRDELEARGERLVFTNGCFDLLHAGHVRYLEQARALGDALLVALNDDDSVRALKGEGRPLHPAEDRAEVLLGLRSVNAVTVFSGERATDAISVIRPHLYAKGGDYTVDTLHAGERAALEQAGAQIEILGLVPGRSTSSTIRRMRVEEGTRPRLGVLGSGTGTNFDSIAEAIDEGRLEAEIVLVLSDIEDSPILEKARRRGLPARFVDPGPDPRRLPLPAQKEFRDRLVAAEVDLVILAGFLRIVKDPILETFEGRILNIHPSLLPKHKGLRAWEQAFEAGDEVAGCTVHHVNEELDSGAIVLQAEVPVLPDDTVDSLYQRIQVEEHRIYPESIAKVWAERCG